MPLKTVSLGDVLSRCPWLATAAAVIVGQTLLSFVFGPSFTKATSIAVSLLFAALMLRASRFAWVVILIGAAGQMANSVLSIDPHWVSVAAGTIVVACLLIPSSVRYVWSPSSHQRTGWLQRAVKRLSLSVKNSTFRLLSQVAQWKEGEIDLTRKRSYGVLIWRLGIGCVILLILFGVAYNWQQGSGHDSSSVNIVVNVTWTGYVLTQLAFIGVSVVAMYRHFTTLRGGGKVPKSARVKSK
ncbi:MAG TPA: hypothetical protein VIE64_00890 [Solirubrobacterales bacterium]|jgi:hypothetical protein